MTIQNALTVLVIMLLSGCATYKPPTRLWETDVARILSDVEKTHPREKLYRQYVSDKYYFQFDRISENNVIYGWLTCTDCSWTRHKMAAIYDGSYLYVTYGQHEHFFLSQPDQEPMYSDSLYWRWNVVDKYRVEGRNLIQLSQFRKCRHRTPMIREWTDAPYLPGPGEIDCRYGGEAYNSIYVATIDETLVGRRDSIVGQEKETVKERLNALEELYKEGVISESEYNQKRREILSEL